MTVYAWDTETTGLDPYHGARIFCWSLATSKGAKFYPKTRANLRHLVSVLNNPNNVIVGQNLKFDLKMLLHEGVDVFELKAKFHDILLLSKVLDSVAFRHDLRYLVRRYLGAPCADKDEIDIWLAKNKRRLRKELEREPNFSDVPRSIVKKRVMWDTTQTLALFNILHPRAQEVCPDLYETERQLLWVVLDMEHRGITVDITRARELRALCQKYLDKVTRKLNSLVCPLEVTFKKKGKVVTEAVNEFNPNSSTRHVPAAFRKVGIELIYKTVPKKNKKKGTMSKGGNWCFDEPTMVRYMSDPIAALVVDSSKESWSLEKFWTTILKAIDKHSLEEAELLPALILKYRELSKLISTYYNHLIDDPVDRYITPTGREYGVIHCHFNQADPMTGRFSSSGPNLQNMPRKLGPRECFVPRKGCNFWLPDYAQVEMRFYCHFAKDQKMASRLSLDLHRQTAAEMFKKAPEDITKEERERAGTVNFTVIYGAGPPRIAETLTKRGAPTNTAQATQMRRKYYLTYPLVPRTAKRLGRELKRVGYIENPYGRRYYIPKKLCYKALNYMCQGTSADQIKKAMVEIWLWLRENGYRTRILLQVHDELGFEIPYTETLEVIPVIVKMMEERKKFFVPITVGLDVATKRWSSKEGVELEDLKKYAA